MTASAVLPFGWVALIGLCLASPAHAETTPHSQSGSHPPEHPPEPALTPGMSMGRSTSMRGMLGSYSMTREASGTSWQPDATPMEGVHSGSGPWNIMWHGSVSVIYDHQNGARGDDKTFGTGMLMSMAQRPLGQGTLGLRGMISLDPLMGKSGYPLLFQTGETADGQTALVDRQHPHDFLMELAASYSRPLSENSSVFGYIGLPGSPALGPAAYMHRSSGKDNPEAPLAHHWLDSTHIAFGVVTVGAVWRDLKVEGSIFNGREPDHNRWNLETRKLDSASARLSWNPTPAWSMQISHGRLDSPELLEPEVSIRRTTASASYHYDFGAHRLYATLAWGHNRKQPGRSTDGWLLESELKLGEANTLFGRLERVEKDELFHAGEPLAGQTFTVDKLSIGAMRDLGHVGHAVFSVGGLVSGYRVPSALDSVYGSNPTSYLVFLRAKIE